MLSKRELDLVTNAEWILTKNGILEKVKLLLADLQETQAGLLKINKDKLPEDVFMYPPKISKGENYRGLPYLILDSPRVFQKDDILAIRTMFWWGNFFSVTLHLSGKYKRALQDKIASKFETLGNNGFSICINNDQWHHDFSDSNYREVLQLKQSLFTKIVEDFNFIKLAKKIPLEDWDGAAGKLAEYSRELIGLIT